MMSHPAMCSVHHFAGDHERGSLIFESHTLPSLDATRIHQCNTDESSKHPELSIQQPASALHNNLERIDILITLPPISPGLCDQGTFRSNTTYDCCEVPSIKQPLQQQPCHYQQHQYPQLHREQQQLRKYEALCESQPNFDQPEGSRFAERTPASSMSKLRQTYNHNSECDQIDSVQKPVLCSTVSRGTHYVTNRMGLTDFAGRCRHQDPGLLTRWSYVLLFLLLRVSHAMVQSCDTPPTAVDINEIQPAGTELFNVSAPANFTWRFDVVSASDNWLKDYIQGVRDPSAEVYRITLIKPLDLEEIDQLYGHNAYPVPFDLYCRRDGFSEISSNVLIFVDAVNEFDPEFNTSSIEISVKETVPINSTLLTLREWAFDKDVNARFPEIEGFLFSPYTGDPQNDGNQWLTLSYLSGAVSPKLNLDYEALPAGRKYITTGIVVRDRGGRTNSSSVTVNIEDDDDLPPRFLHSGYTVTVGPNVTGPVTEIQPAPIEARDGDALGYSVTYHIVQGPPDYAQYISIDSTSGQISIIQELRDAGLSDWVLIIEAREVSAIERSTTASLHISVAGVTVGGSVARGSSSDSTLITVAIILSVITFIILVLAVIGYVYFRKKYKKVVHPEGTEAKSKEGVSKAESRPPTDSSHPDRPGSLRLVEDEQMDDDNDMSWVGVARSNDIVDLSDEDTIRIKKKLQNGAPPTSTKFYNPDSAYEGSDKKSGSDDSARHRDYPETEYAEVDSPPGTRKEKEFYRGFLTGTADTKKADSQMMEDHVYNNTPSNTPKGDTTSTQQLSGTTTGEGDNHDNEYVTPQSSGTKQPLPPTFFYNRAFRHDNDDHLIKQHRPGGQRKPERKSLKGINKSAEGVTSFGSKTTQNKELEEDEGTEYCTPKSNKKNYVGRPLPIPEDVDESQLTSINFADQRPKVPPRPNLRVLSGLKGQADYADDEDHYATVDKKKESPSVQTDHIDADHSAQSSSAENSPIVKPSSAVPLHAPARRKRPRKRPKASRSPEDMVFDGTKDYDDIGVDSGFYTDTSKTKIKRSSRLPIMKPDPNDTRYWITVSDGQ